jgi:ribosomal protein S15P/S13E
MGHGMTDREQVLRGEKAQAILESPLWMECWDIYEQRLMQEFQSCKTDDVSRMQQIKMLLLAGKAAKSHLEAILKDGEFAAKNIEFQEQSRLKKVANLFRK